MEIVTRPVLGLGDQAPEVGRAYMSYLRDLMRALGVSQARMERGHMRCDANPGRAGSSRIRTRMK